MRFGQHVLDSGSDTNLDCFLAVYDYTDTDANDPALVPPPGLSCHPNPGSHRFQIRARDAAEARIYNSRGQLVRALRAASGSSFTWDARDETGARCPCGVYLIKAGPETGKILLVDE